VRADPGAGLARGDAGAESAAWLFAQVSSMARMVSNVFILVSPGMVAFAYYSGILQCPVQRETVPLGSPSCPPRSMTGVNDYFPGLDGVDSGGCSDFRPDSGETVTLN
jgi:hypothetical protein